MSLLDRLRYPPTPPRNVRAVLADGSEVPLEVVYVGWRDGAHRWEAVVQLGCVPESMRIDALPAKTAVAVRCAR